MAFLILLFIVVPVVEIWVIIEVGSLIGVLPTIALLIADALLGSLLLRHQGRGAWQRFNRAIAEGRFPAREVADGLLIAIGGTLLLTPGFVTDLFGVLFLLPPTRAIVRRLLRGWAKRRLVVVGAPAGFGAGAGRGFGGTPPGAQGNGVARDYDFEGTAEEVEGDDPQLPGGGSGRASEP